MTPEFRNPTGWTHHDMGKWQRIDLLTTQPVDDEIFASLEYISEVDKVGVQFFKDLGYQNPKELLLIFRAFIRQAKTFYYAAKQLHYRASALLYYYAFLNLAKAYITLSDPNSVSERISHGLMYKFMRGNLRSQGVFLPPSMGVFQILYEIETSVNIPANLKMSIVTLLGYCTDVAYEYEMAGFGNRKITPVMVRMLLDRQNKISWPLIAVANFSLINPYKKALKSFYKHFDRVVPEIDFVRQAFNIYAESFSIFTFFQSRKVYQWQENDIVSMVDIKDDFHNALGNLYNPILHNEKADFYLVSPFRKNFQIPFSQPLAIYVIMFYLGSLVRYNPSYLEKLLNSKDAWLIERFTKSSPGTFLRYIANAILQKNYVYMSR
ncbi:MAG: YaaC family protein [Anaerolineales bacterium]|nr:YaaC family protein [Anaerolineales bacterium]